jgi:hypothetical protein
LQYPSWTNKKLGMKVHTFISVTCKGQPVYKQETHLKNTQSKKDQGHVSGGRAPA